MAEAHDCSCPLDTVEEEVARGVDLCVSWTDASSEDARGCTQPRAPMMWLAKWEKQLAGSRGSVM